jgi:hypothetical protein
MPTVLLGTAVGAAVVYGIDEGDPMAVQKKVLPKVRQRQQLERCQQEWQPAAAATAVGLGFGIVYCRGSGVEALAATAVPV